jgi:branched-chain amino acid transport system permease protein
LAAVIGALSTRTRGVYFSMVTLALGQLLYYVALQASSWTGGENGLRGFTVRQNQPVRLADRFSQSAQ